MTYFLLGLMLYDDGYVTINDQGLSGIVWFLDWDFENNMRKGGFCETI